MPEGGRSRRPGARDDVRDHARGSPDDHRRTSGRRRASRGARDRTDGRAPTCPLRRRGATASSPGTRAGADARLGVARPRVRPHQRRSVRRTAPRRPYERCRLRRPSTGRVLARRGPRRRRLVHRSSRIPEHGVAQPARPVVARSRDASPRGGVRAAGAPRSHLPPRHDDPRPDPCRIRRARGAPGARPLPAVPAPPAGLHRRLSRSRGERGLRGDVGARHPRRLLASGDERRRRKRGRGGLQARSARPAPSRTPGRGRRRRRKRAPARSRGRARRARPHPDALRRVLGGPEPDQGSLPRRLVRHRRHGDGRRGRIPVVPRASERHAHQPWRALRPLRQRASASPARRRRRERGRRRARSRARRTVPEGVRRTRAGRRGVGRPRGGAAPGRRPVARRARGSARDRVRRRASDRAGRKGSAARAPRASRRRPTALGDAADNRARTRVPRADRGAARLERGRRRMDAARRRSRAGAGTGSGSR